MPLGKPLLLALERMCLGGVILDPTGCVLDFNEVTLALLQVSIGSSHAVLSEKVRSRLKTLLHRGEARFSLNESAWILSPQGDKRPLAIYAVPAGEPGDVFSRTVVILADLERTPQPSPTALQRIFGLTPTEASLALQIAAGATPNEIAREKGVKLATVRSQLASVFTKTRTRRQSELVALLARVAILP